MVARTATRLAWVTGRRAVTVRGALAELPEQSLRKFEHPVRVRDWSPDGAGLSSANRRAGHARRLWLLPASRAAASRARTRSRPSTKRRAVVSPDGRWIAYASDESGRFEIYVDSFPDAGHRAR